LLFLVGCRVSGVKAGLLSALLFCVYPGSVYWGRMAYANHLLTLNNLIVLYLILKHFSGERVSPRLIGLLLGAGVLIEYTGLLTVFSVITLFYLYDRANTKHVLLSALSLPLFFSIFMLYLMPSEFKYMILWQLKRFSLFSVGKIFVLVSAAIAFYVVFRFKYFFYTLSKIIKKDLVFLFGARASNPSMLFLFSINFALAFSLLSAFTKNQVNVGFDYFWLGLLGLFYVSRVRERNSLFFFTLPFVALLFLFDRGDHMLIPLHPFFSLGVSILLLRLHDFAKSLFRSRFWVFVPMLLIYHPLVFSLYADASAFTQESILVRESLSDNKVLVEYLNNHVSGGELVLGEPKIIQGVRSDTATILQGIAYEGQGALYYPPNYPHTFHLLNSSYKRAKYVAVGKDLLPYLREWDTDEKALSDIASWPIEYSRGDYVVYHNTGVVE